MNWSIRNELISDFRLVEEITRKAFWNLHKPGCDEHYLVHVMRNHGDFIPELDLVLEVDGRVIGNIMYTRSALIDERGCEKPILTFGPVSILPEYQRKGYGKKLIEYSFGIAQSMGHEVIVIFGNPANYVSLGFKSCMKFNICYGEAFFPTALLVKELREGALKDEQKMYYRESDVFTVNEEDAEKFDRDFEKMEKRVTPSQEEFFILSNSRLFPLTA